MQIREVIHRLPTFIALIKLRGHVITTTITAANFTQARELLTHLYGANNVLALSKP